MSNVQRLRPLLTRDDVLGKPTTDAAHLDMARGESIWTYGVAATPRITVHDWSKRGVGSRRTWMVDGTAVRDLDCALAVVNGTMTLEEAMPQPEAPEPPRKISIDQQIEEVEYELGQRRNVYPRLVRKGSMGQGVADYHMQRMQAVLATLQWCRENRETIAAVHAQAREEAKCSTSNDAADAPSSSP